MSSYIGYNSYTDDRELSVELLLYKTCVLVCLSNGMTHISSLIKWSICVSFRSPLHGEVNGGYNDFIYGEGAGISIHYI